MIDLQINGGSIGIIPNTADEFTIQQFEYLIEVLSDQTKSEMEKYYDLLVKLGVEEDKLDTLPVEKFKEVVAAYKFTPSENQELRSEFELDGVIYRSAEDFEFNVWQSKTIERYMIDKPERYLGEFCAIIFRPEGIPLAVTKTDAYIKEKGAMFREKLSVGILLPYLQLWSEAILTELSVYGNS